MVDPEAKSNHVDQKVEKVAINILKTALRTRTPRFWVASYI